MDDEEPLLLEQRKVFPLLEVRAVDDFEQQIGLTFGYVRARPSDELVEQMAVAGAPVFESLREAAVILGGFAHGSADDLRPAVGHVEQARDVGVRERHAAGLGDVANLRRVERQTLCIAEHSRTLVDEAPYLKGDARAAGNQQPNFVGKLLHQQEDRGDALFAGYIFAIQYDLQRRALGKRAKNVGVRAALALAPERVPDVTPDRAGIGAGRKRAVDGVARAVAQIAEQRHALTEARRCDQESNGDVFEAG